MLDILVESLVKNKRCLRNKVAHVIVGAPERNREDFLSELDRVYRFNQGGIVIIRSKYNVSINEFFAPEVDEIHNICEVIRDHLATTTTIIYSSNDNPNQFKVYREELEDVLFVELNDKVIYNEDAVLCLNKIALQAGVEDIATLKDEIKKDTGYKLHEIREIFNVWYKSYVREVQFPQYKNMYFKPESVEEKKIANESLNSLIGLNSVKELVKSCINYEKIKQVLRENGKEANLMCRHMVFTGNPGTAKTTVARIIAQIMKENNMLSSGHLVEVGRSDIVSKYLGGTAPKVKELFKRARGGVLFIDEAYSLCEHKGGMYGDEAINTIVQEMENNRENTVVIFAGYKREMESFLTRNSGLNSRIAYHIDFPDYSTEELVEIAKYQASKMGVELVDCDDVITKIAEAGKQQRDFGNGRFIRNVLEKAIVKQANRLVAENKIILSEIKQLRAQDFDMPIEENKKF